MRQLSKASMSKVLHCQRPALFAFALLLLALGLSCVVWVRKEQRQYALDRRLIAALVHADTKRAFALVEAGANPNTRYKPTPEPTLVALLKHLLHCSPTPLNNSPTAFLMACGAGWCSIEDDFQKELPCPHSAQLVQKIIACGADVHAQTSAHESPFRGATESDCLQTAELLLSQGANIDEQVERGRTPLMTACEYGRQKMVTMLLAHGANVNISDMHGYTALFLAVSVSENKAIVRQLLERNANANTPEFFGDTAFTIAQKHNRPDIVALLRKYSKHP